MATIFDNKTFDVAKFLSVPKCKGTYVDNNGSKCLLSAFVEGFGFIVKRNPGCLGTDVYYDNKWIGTIDNVFQEIDKLANQLFHKIDFFSSEMPKFPMDFTSAVIQDYDEGDPKAAIDLVFQLIDKLPKRTINKLQSNNQKSKASCVPK